MLACYGMGGVKINSEKYRSIYRVMQTCTVSTERRKLELALFGENKIPELLEMLPEYFWVVHIGSFLKANNNSKFYFSNY